MRSHPPSLLALAGLALTLRVAAGTPTIDYNRDIRPILSETCFPCHGFDEKARKAKLRLDVAESAYAEHASGLTPLKPGDLDHSDVWQRVTSTYDDEVMPPPTESIRPTPAQLQKIKTWILEGAKYSMHWSFVPPVKAPVPAIAGVSNPIDAFVRDTLAHEKLPAAPEADRRTLIRRVTLDLTGLPPTAAEVEAFAADSDPAAYEKLVTRLLATAHFGERMALDWLDAARYADTNGFSIDGGRHLWLWRDWVIQAFNDNKPYDQFLVEQLAGDLLPNHTSAQLIATGFQRNNMVTHEGGTIPEENLTNYNVDRVKTLGEAVLGLTVACAQCHDHKYDPITQRDYYGLYAFFNTLSDKGLDGNAGINPGPAIKAHTVLRTTEEPELRRQIAALEAAQAKPDPAVLARWEYQQRAILAAAGRDLALHPVDVQKVSTPNKGAGFGPDGANRVRIRDGGDLAAFDIATVLPKTGRPITGLRIIFNPVPDAPGGGWGYGPKVPPRSRAAKAKPAAIEAEGSGEGEPPRKGTFMLTAIAATADAVPGDQVNLNKLLPIRRVTASSWDPANPPAGCLDPRNDDGWSPDAATNGPVRLTLTFASPIRAEATPYLTVQLNFGHGKGLIAGSFELLAMTGNDDDTDLPANIVQAIRPPAPTGSGKGLAPPPRSPQVAAELWAYCAAHAVELEPRRVALANIRERLAVLTDTFPTMVMDVAAKPRDTFILNRGDYAQPTVKVTAATLAVLPPMPSGAPSNRLGLAQWLTMKDHPLTARVAVNRIWKLFFGAGLVRTPADFGAQGEWPTHPELLDWLAVDFVEHGWDVKRLVTQIVTSATYRQSSAATPAQLERDPQNRLLGRGPRFRLPAEFIRDSALQVSGLLVDRIGGPSVNPYMPGDLWREVSHYGSTPATSQTFVQDHGEKLYRRSLYTYWKRTAPPPAMTTFDAPNREICTVARAETTTPLQALVLLDDPQFVEAARKFAERILARPENDTLRIRWAFEEVTSRDPRPPEISVIAKALVRERRHYAADRPAAEHFLAVGESPRDPKFAASELAAWAQIATLLLNLSETVTRN